MSASTSIRRKHPRALMLGGIGLAAFLLWRTFSLGAFIRGETRPPAWDQSVHLEIAVDYRNALREGRWSELWHLKPKPGMPPFPPLYHLGIVAAQSVLGSGSDPLAAANAALWLNWFYLGLLSLSLFGIAYEFFGDETALAAAVAFACAPAVQDLAHTQLIDLAVTACSAAAYWAFLRSAAFSRRGGSLAFGLAFAVGMLHKWSFFSYMIPIAFATIPAIADTKRRGNALAAWGLAAALAGPWYLTHLPVLVPRLFQASSDFAVPVWKGGAFFIYFFTSIEQLGPALWLLGWIGVMIPSVRKRYELAWTLPAMVLASYVFWAIVPNRQFRFLLPGLPALAVLACGPWPRTLVWALAGFQAVSAANYGSGRIGPVRLPIAGWTVQCLTSSPPVRQDWKIADILKEAARRRPADHPFSNVTLVANLDRFNGPTFNWYNKLLDLPLRIRGVNHRLCEFSDFVVLKRGNLGPGGVIEGLPEAADEIAKKGGWFERAYERVASWPLPDGSEAVLYAQRRPATPPIGLALRHFDRYATGPFEASDLRIEPGPWNASSSTYAWIRISAAEAKLRGLRITRLNVELHDVRLAPAGPRKENPLEDIRFLRMKTLRVKSAVVTAEDFRAFLLSRAPGLIVRTAEIDGTVHVRAVFRGVPLEAQVLPALSAAPKGLMLAVTQAAAGPLSLPESLLRRIHIPPVSFEPNPETPFLIGVPSITLRDNRLTIP